MKVCRTHRKRNCSTCTELARNKGYKSFPENDTTLFVVASSSDYGYGSTDYGYGSTDYGSGSGSSSSYDSGGGGSSSCGGGGGGE